MKVQPKFDPKGECVFEYYEAGVKRPVFVVGRFLPLDDEDDPNSGECHWVFRLECGIVDYEEFNIAIRKKDLGKQYRIDLIYNYANKLMREHLSDK